MIQSTPPGLKYKLECYGTVARNIPHLSLSWEMAHLPPKVTTWIFRYNVPADAAMSPAEPQAARGAVRGGARPLERLPGSSAGPANTHGHTSAVPLRVLLSGKSHTQSEQVPGVDGHVHAHAGAFTGIVITFVQPPREEVFLFPLLRGEH